MKPKLLILLLSSSLAYGQNEAQPNNVEDLDPIIIESSPLSPSVSESTQAWSVLSGEDLEKAKRATIAETLSEIPGVSQTGFGPAANRPIIRGLDKYRVRVLQNGTDTFDFSAQSEDHAVPIDPLLVDRIEVLRGASALLYGGNAIGGVVNVIDRRIPTTPYGEPGAALLSSYSSVNDGLNYGASAFGSSGKLNFQINGSKRDYNDYDAPSFYTEDHHNPSAPPEGPFNKVENSYGDSSTIGFGGSYMLDSGYAGLSFSRYENTYGVPGEHAKLDTRIEMESDRFEFRSEIEVSGSEWLNSIELNFGYGDYKHSEIGKEQPSDTTLETHSTFLRKGYEGRIAFDHEIGDFRGVFGVHGLFDELKIEGDESILGGLTQAPDTANPKITSEDSNKIALFLIEEYDLDAETTLNAGIRWENQDRDYQATGSLDPDRDDSTFSATGGISRDINEMWNISGNLSYSERAPDTAELYSDGPHHATEAYEFGSPNLDIESARGVEIVVRKTVGKVTGQFSAFHTRFNNYVFLEDAEKVRDGEGNLADDPGPDTILGNGDDEFVDPNTEGLPVKGYEAAKAEFQGIEIEIDWLAMENPGWDLLLSAYGDMLRGKNKTEGVNLARIPATRLGLGFEVQQEKLDFGAKFIRSFKQDKVAVHDDHSEDPTAAHSLLSAYASYDFSAGDSVGQIFLRGYNLTDELAYNHSSLLKQFSPLPGRSVEIGLKFDF
jgi:iron complex outermembrane receptor protein